MESSSNEDDENDDERDLEDYAGDDEGGYK